MSLARRGRTLPAGLPRTGAGEALTLEIEPSPVDVVVRADDGGLATILDNLVGNAIQYTPDGGRVAIRYRAEGDSAVLEVEDTGVGISPR